MAYDSTADTTAHINRVRTLLEQIEDNIFDRGTAHDRTKLEDPEKPLFDEYTPRLAETEYGSDEYFEDLKGLQPALDHHYATYRHHPEHHPNGIDDMNFLDLLEMLADWKAAGERQADGGDLRKSIEFNAKRFGYDEKMTARLLSTAEELGWLC